MLFAFKTADHRPQVYHKTIVVDAETQEAAELAAHRFESGPLKFLGAGRAAVVGTQTYDHTIELYNRDQLRFLDLLNGECADDDYANDEDLDEE